MARSTTDICLTLRPSTVQAVDAAAQAARRSRSQYIDLLLTKALTGEDRLHALQVRADFGIEEFAEDANREKSPNATQVIAEASVDGHARLRAHQKIAGGGR